MLMSPDSKSFPHTGNDYGLFGAVNVQPKEAEYYRSQVTRKDLEFATLRVNRTLMLILRKHSWVRKKI